jgi:ABC-type transporter Mla maintaining outer membrane lipid asymmetry permease subunit MlaE
VLVWTRFRSVGLVSLLSSGLTMALLTGLSAATLRNGTAHSLARWQSRLPRELGPLLTGIMLAARIGCRVYSGTGTMQVN